MCNANPEDCGYSERDAACPEEPYCTDRREACMYASKAVDLSTDHWSDYERTFSVRDNSGGKREEKRLSTGTALDAVEELKALVDEAVRDAEVPAGVKGLRYCRFCGEEDCAHSSECWKTRVVETLAKL